MSEHLGPQLHQLPNLAQLIPALATPIIGAAWLVGLCAGLGAPAQLVVGIDDVLLASVWALAAVAAFSALWIYYASSVEHWRWTAAAPVAAASLMFTLFSAAWVQAAGYILLSLTAFAALYMVLRRAPRPQLLRPRLKDRARAHAQYLAVYFILPVVAFSGPGIAGLVQGTYAVHCNAAPAVASRTGCFLVWSTSKAAVLACGPRRAVELVMHPQDLSTTAAQRQPAGCPAALPYLARALVLSLGQAFADPTRPFRG